MPRSSNPSQAGGSTSSREENEAMENQESESSSSGQSDEGSSSGSSGTSESSTSSSQVSQSSEGQLTPPTQRRTQMRTHQQRQRLSKNSTSVACQTDYSDEWSPMRDPNTTDDNDGQSTSEGTLRLMIQNFRSMSDTVRGPSKELMGVSWRIMVMPRQHAVQKKGTQKCLGFFLQCCPDAYSEQWSCTAQAELRLISQKPNVPHFTRKTNHTYTAKENDWGYSCFMTWADILDENQGYIKEDRVVLEVTVKAEQAKNVLSHVEFTKRITKWKNLAEMHYARNCIDLAIEANFQAIKYCKDRDADVKATLEEQRAFFIEQKVKESIKRIQKKTEEPQSEEQGTSQSALKQALTQSTSKFGKKGKPQKKVTRRYRERSQSPATTPPPQEVHVENRPKTETASVCKSTENENERSDDEEQPHRRHHVRICGMFNPNLGDVLPCLHKVNQYDLAADVDIEDIRRSISWTHRTKEEDQFYNDITLPFIGESLGKLSIDIDDIDGENLESYTQQLAAYDHETQQILFEQLLQRNFMDAFAKKQKKSNRRDEAIRIAKKFTDDVNAKAALTPDETAAIEEEIADLGATLAFIDDEKSKAWRYGLLDRMNENLWSDNSLFLLIQRTPFPVISRNIKIQLEEPIPSQARWLREGFYSENEENEDEEEPFSEDERQNDGCSLAKRVKRDRNTVSATLVEMACQTDIMPKKAGDEEEATYDAAVKRSPSTDNTVHVVNAQQPQRVLKKTTKRSKRAEAVPASNSSTAVEVPRPAPPRPVTAAPTREWSATREESRESSPEMEQKENETIDGTFKELTEEQQNVMITEDFVRGWIAEAERQGQSEGGGTGPTNSLEFINAHCDQVVSALNGTGHVFIRVRNLIRAVHELMTVMTDREVNTHMNKIFEQLLKMGGIQFEIPADQAHRHMPDISLGDENVVLTKEINFIEDLKKRLEAKLISEKVVLKKVDEAMKALGDKMVKANNVVEEITKKYVEKEKNLKKEEKAMKAETAAIRLQLQAEKDKALALQKDLKEKSKETKRQETRAATVTLERDELAEKLKSSQSDMKALIKKHNDEVNKLRRDLTAANESRKQLQIAIADHENQNKSQQHTIEEKNNQLKKVRHELSDEKQKHVLANRELEKALERAKKSEIDLLTRELEAGITLLERASSDAGKHCTEMEDAINKARTQSEMNAYMNSQNEWNQVVETIKSYIKKAEVEFSSHIEAIQGGKPLSALPKISVAKPPPAPQIIKVPVIAQVEPTKTAPGPIGPPRAHAAPSQISPQDRVHSSPSPAPQKLSQLPSPSSPVRHQPGAIGTRPSGIGMNGHHSNGGMNGTMNGAGHNGYERSSFYDNHNGQHNNTNANGNANSLLSNWSWSEPLENILNSHTSPCNDLLSIANNQSNRKPTIDQNGWDEATNTWSNQSSHNNVNNYISGPLQHSSSQNGNYGNSQNRASSATSSMFGQSPGWNRPTSAQAQHLPDLQKVQAYSTRNWIEVIAYVEKKLNIEHDKAIELARRYLVGSGLNLSSSRFDAEAVADTVIQKYMMEQAARNGLPPGAAPGYLQNPMLSSGYADRSGFSERNSLNNMSSMLANGHESYGLLNLLGDSMRPSSTTDKWSNGF